MSPNADERSLATHLLSAFVGNVVKNGYLLIDVTGNVTFVPQPPPSNTTTHTRAHFSFLNRIK